MANGKMTQMTVFTESVGASFDNLNGGEENRRQVIDVNFKLDKNTMAVRKANILGRKGMYSIGGDASTFRVQPGQALVFFDNERNDGPQGAREVMNVTNGVGADIVAEYPNDPESQRLALKARMHFAGFAAVSVDTTQIIWEELFTGQIHGDRTITTDADVAPFDLLQIDCQTENDVKNKKYTRKQKFGGDIDNQVRPIFKKYEPATISNRFIAYRNLCLKDPEKFRRVFNPLGVSEGGIDNCLKALFETQLFSSLFFLYRILSNNSYFNLFFPRGIPVGGLTPKFAVDTINRIAVGLELVDTKSDQSVSLTKQEANSFLLSKQDILNTINFDGISKLGYGQSIATPAVQSGTGLIEIKPEYASIYQQMKAHQFNHSALGVSAYAHLVKKDMQPIVGVVTKGGRAGENIKVLALA